MRAGLLLALAALSLPGRCVGVVCSRGYAGVDTCSPCPAGSLARNVGQTSCTTCFQDPSYKDNTVINNRGYYQPSTGQSVCLACTVGQAASKPQTSCVTPWSCPAGQYVSSSYVCDVCQAGSYNPGTYTVLQYYGQRCITCPSGTFQAQSGFSTCAQCATGKVPAAATGATSCFNCLANTAPDATSTYCVCPNGYVNVNVTHCTPCPAGTYNSQARGYVTDCQQCTAGFYALAASSACASCPGGYTSPDSAAACVQCPPGFRTTGYYTDPVYGLQNRETLNKCLPCVNGSYSVSASTTCQACAAGKYSEAGASQCTDCAAGKYSYNYDTATLDGENVLKLYSPTSGLPVMDPYLPFCSQNYWWLPQGPCQCVNSSSGGIPLCKYATLGPDGTYAGGSTECNSCTY